MAGVYKRPESKTLWWIDFRFRGTRYREPGGRTKKQAEARLEARQKEVRGGQQTPDHRRPGFTIADLKTLWLESPRAQRKRSLSDDKQRFEVILELLGERTQADALTRANIDGPAGLIDKLRKRSGHTARQMSDATINRYLALLRAAFRYAMAQKRVHKNPVEGVKLFRESHRKRTCRPQELEALIDAADPELRLAIQLAHATGMRIGEIAGLEWSQVDLQERLVHLRRQETKTDEARTVPLMKSAAAALSSWRKNKAPSDSVFSVKAMTLSSRFSRLTRELELDDLRFHDLRRTAATNLRRAGVDLLTVAEITGHKSLEMLKRYQAILDEDKLAAVDRLDG